MDLRGMEKGLALAGSVVMLNLCPCNIDFLLLPRLSIRARPQLFRIYPFSVSYFVSSVSFTRVTVYHTYLEVEVLYPRSLLAVWVSWLGGVLTDVLASVPLMSSCSRIHLSPLHVLLLLV